MTKATTAAETTTARTRTPAARVAAAAAAVAFETLEGRQLFAAGGVIPAPAAPLTLNLTPGPDTVVLKQVGDQLNVQVNGAAPVVYDVDGKFVPGPGGMNVPGITKVVVNLNNGSDVLAADESVKVRLEVRGGGGNDTITGGAADDTIWGGDGGSPNSSAEIGADTISGGGGSDLLFAATVSGAKLFGGPGYDTLTGGDGGDQLSGGDGSDTLRGGKGNDGLWGGAGGDTLQGGDDSDALYGGADTDVLDGGYGADTISGGDGWDRVDYAGRTRGVSLSLDGVANDGQPKVYDADVAEQDNLKGDLEWLVGGSGNDSLIGDGNGNWLFGGAGHDTIRGNGGNDRLDGGAGNDNLYGGDGADVLLGQEGFDRLYGGAGADTMEGGLGRDTLVAVGGGADKLQGRADDDSFWVGSGDTTDVTAAEKDKRTFHHVGAFANGASIEPLGQDIADPSLDGMDGTYYGKNFNTVPLFGSAGPKAADVRQGGLGDCYYLAGLAGVAQARPDVIRESVVELGDGTYAVRLYTEEGAEKYYRVDGQLPLTMVDGEEYVAFAAPGKSGDPSMWVPLMEKAWALHREPEQEYYWIEGDADILDAGMPWEAFPAVGYTDYDLDELFWTKETTTSAKIKNTLANGGAVAASTDIGLFGTDLTSTHVYTVTAISPDGQTITLRNPWGKDDDGFAWGADDGFIRMSIGDFDDSFFYVAYSLLK